MGKAAQPLRVAITGAAVSPPLGETLALLGKDDTLARIDRCVAHHAAERSA
jgi:glutamyl-tRNA synthetase